MSSSNPNTDQDILENRTPGTNPDLDVSQNASSGGDVNPMAGQQSTEADTHNPGPVPVAGYTPDQLGSKGQVGQSVNTTAAAGPPGTANQTDTTIGENYTGGPKEVDPEQQLLNPGYEPQIPGGSGRQAATPGRPGFADNPGLGGMPDQTGQLDQTTYNNGGTGV